MRTELVWGFCLVSAELMAVLRGVGVILGNREEKALW